MRRIGVSIRILVFFLSVALPGNAPGGDWQTFTNQNNVSEIIYAGGQIWGATTGGAFSYNAGSGEISSLTNIQGLRGLNLNALEVDALGNIWFAPTEGYLNKFDTSGVFLDSYLFEERLGPTRRSLVLYDLKSDGDRLWVAHDLGLSLFLIEHNGGEIKETAQFLGDLTASEDVLCLEVTDSLIWAGTAAGVAFTDKFGLNIQNPRSWRSYQQSDPQGLTNFKINSILEFDQEIYLGTGAGVFRFDINGQDTSWQAFGLGSREVAHLSSVNGVLTALTDQGIYEYGSGAWQPFPTDSLPRPDLSSIVFGPGEKRWVSMEGEGLAYYDAYWHSITLPGPLGNSIRDVRVGPDGGVWFVCEGQGLSILSDGEWENSPLVGTGARDLDFDLEANAWLACWGKGLFKITPDWEWSHFDASNAPFGWTTAPSFVALSQVKVDATGNVWILNYNPDNGNSVLILTPDSTWVVYNKFRDPVFSNWFLDLCFSGDTVYFGGLEGFEILDYKGTLQDKSDDGWTLYTENDGLSAVRVNCLAEDLDGLIWIGTSGGLNYYDPLWEYIGSVSLPGELGLTINDIFVDGLSQKWVGTASGLGRLSPDNSTWEVYNSANSHLVHDEVHSLDLEETTGVLWIGTLGGISRFDTGILAPSEDLSDISVFPNPANRDTGHRKVYFKRVPRGARVSIYTVAGEKVREFFSPNDGGFTSWDLANEGGKAVAGGIYLFNISKEGHHHLGKIAVIR
jgi:ligand-binding sensor domain-containing protein